MNKPVVTVIGAGMGGSLISYLLAKKGYRVNVYESRGDTRKTPPNSDRSINQSLSIRGIGVLQKVGLWKRLKKLTLIEKGRTVHPISGSRFFSPYGRNAREVQYSFNRNSFNGALLDIAQGEKNIKIFFNTICKSVNTEAKTVNLKNTESGKTEVIKTDLLVDASGINSLIRQSLEGSGAIKTVRKDLDWGYKSLYVPYSQKLKDELTDETFHIWPREGSTLFSIPNINGSFVFTLILPNKKFAFLNTDLKIKEFFEKNYPDVTWLIPHFSEGLKNNKLGRFECIHTSKWYFKDWIVLLGDSVHAIMPFYNQGTTAAFEDCLELVRDMSSQTPNFEKAFSRYQTARKINTDTLTDLSYNRFFELKNGFRSKTFLAKDRLEFFLSKVLFGAYKPLYTFIAHTSVPYHKAHKQYLTQRNIAKMLGFDLAAAVYSKFI